VSSGLQRLLTLADRERVRFSMAVVLTGALCLALLARSVGWLSSSEPPPRAPTTMEMRLVELAPPTPIASTAPATHAQAAPPPQTQRQPLAHAAPSRNSPTPAPQPREETHPPIEPPTHDQPAAAVTQAPSSTTTTSSEGTAPAAPPAPSGSTQARLLSQPMPVLPDDLREQGYQVTAIAHFKVHADGTFEVELIKPTQNPRLNQILLETLHRWRFFPAMENGHPVESDQDVRVHFSVS